MHIVTHRKIFYTISLALVLLSLIAFVIPGPTYGIDFKGGSVLEVSYPGARPAQQDVSTAIDTLGLGGYSLRPVSDSIYNVRTREISEVEKQNLLNALSLDGTIELREEQFNSVGPVIGRELRTKAFLAIAVTILGIVLYITFAFRKVSAPVASWKYGLATIIALAHDIIISAGLFILFAPLFGGEVDLLFITALLAILGYSVHDTIVVFDRVREHLAKAKDSRAHRDFGSIVGESIEETFGRSITTSLTILLVLLALYFVGGEATQHFSLLLLIGIIAGTYSSIFIASPLLATFEKWQSRTKKT